MAHSITFDTLAFVKRLEAAGFDAKRSEAITEALTEAVAIAFENNANKAATRQDLAELKADLIKWIVGLLFAQTSVFLSILALIKYIN